MLNFSHYVHLRYVLLVNALAALAPSTSVKGRANDPLLVAGSLREISRPRSTGPRRPTLRLCCLRRCMSPAHSAV